MNVRKFAFAAYVFFLILISFVVLEIAARAKYQKSYLAANIDWHRTYHHLLGPQVRGTMFSEGDFNDTFLTNNKGMRGPGDYVYEKKPGSLRIAVMGDSFTFGVGVRAEETYSALLQKRLNQVQSGRYEVLNFGVSSFSPVLEYIYLKNEVIKYKPDMVVISLDLCDLQDDYFYEKRLIYDKNGQIQACDPYSYNGGPDIWANLKRSSVFLTIMDEKLFQSFRKMKTIGFGNYVRNKFKKVRNKTEILVNPNIDNIEFDRFIFMRENKNPDVVSRHWKRTAGYLKKIKQFCDDRGIQMVLMTYPYGHLVGTNQWVKGRKYWAFGTERVYELPQTFSRIESFSEDNGIPFINLLQPLRDHADEALYYNNDGHWTTRGHEVAAQALFDGLESV